jgi:ABC-type nitrate/sulfonate/bicarbonate transport system substrate-binding protein
VTSFIVCLARLFAIACLGLGLASGVVGCEGKNSSRSGQRADDPAVLRYQASPGTVSAPELAEDLGFLAPLRLQFVSSTTSGPQSIQAVATNDTDFGGAFNGAVLKLVAARAPIHAVVSLYGVDAETWNGFYVAEDSPIRSARDLIGKKVAMNTVGAHHEFVLKEYLARGGLSTEQVAQVMLVVIPPANGEQALREHQTDVTVLGGIFRDRALERGGLRLLFSDHELFGSFTAGSYVMRDGFISQHPKTVSAFVAGVAKALEWARTTPRDEVIERFRAIIAKRGRNEDASLLKYWQGFGVEATGGVIQSRDFQLWIDWMVREGELRPGQIQPALVYTNQFNPFTPSG